MRRRRENKTKFKEKKKAFKRTPKQESTLPAGFERLERAIARMGLASRREAKDMIKKGFVKVNNKVIKNPGHGVLVNKDTISIDQKNLQPKESVIVYKPKGIETTKTTPQNRDLKDYFPQFNHLSPIGRLDKDSEGLIILSNDGTLAAALTKEESKVPKEYTVSVREDVSEESLKRMTQGIVIDRVKTKPAKTQRISRTSFKITLTEGRKHQIRRVCAACRLTVTSLIRTKIGHLSPSLKVGAFKKLSEEDITVLKS